MEIVWLIVGAVLLAYANGANDNFKGVATLFGSGTASYARALAWTTAATALGTVVSLVIARGLVEAFSGRGVVGAAVAGSPAFLTAVGGGAALTVLLATAIGMPTSTTHALIGAILGSALASAGGIAWGAVFGRFVTPLVVSPIAAVVLVALAYPAAHRLRRRLGFEREMCVCIDGGAPQAVEVAGDGSLVLARSGLTVELGDGTSCRQRYRGSVVGIELGALADGLHFLSAGAVSFSRAVNDSPKLAAIMLAAPALSAGPALAVIGGAMIVGGLLHSRGIARTMGERITEINPGQGLTANLATSVLVLGASRLGLPVSTTHVSNGALFGLGAVNGKMRWRTVSMILVVWVTTLPAAALLAASIALLLGGG